MNGAWFRHLRSALEQAGAELESESSETDKSTAYDLLRETLRSIPEDDPPSAEDIECFRKHLVSQIRQTNQTHDGLIFDLILTSCGILTAAKQGLSDADADLLMQLCAETKAFRDAVAQHKEAASGGDTAQDPRLKATYDEIQKHLTTLLAEFDVAVANLKSATKKLDDRLPQEIHKTEAGGSDWSLRSLATYGSLSGAAAAAGRVDLTFGLVPLLPLVFIALRDTRREAAKFIWETAEPFFRTSHKAVLRAIDTGKLEISGHLDKAQDLADQIQKVMKELGKQQGETSPTKPSWARDVGADTYGHWAEFEYKGVVQRLRWCPAGKFMMGSPEDEEGRRENEGQQTAITFKSGFWMFDTPVTQELYTTVLGENPSYYQHGSDAAKRPVEGVSWNDSQEFLQRLNEAVPSLSLSLPSEAEWEYACRAGTSGPRYGDNLDAMAWYDENSHQQTQPVAQKAANPWGLYDTLGNVEEWCADAWKGSHEGADPTGLPRQAIDTVPALRVVRGGAWGSGTQGCRAAYRFRGAPVSRVNCLGFRPIQRESK